MKKFRSNGQARGERQGPSPYALAVENLAYCYGGKAEGRPALRGVSLRVKAGEFAGLIGPNGSGKSTLLKCIYRALTPASGKITLEGEDLLSMPCREAASKIAVVVQDSGIAFDFTAEEVVSMGRYHKKKLFDIETAEDREAVRQALGRLGAEGLAKRSYMSLSGGERQRVLIARALAQEASFFVLDEPANHLDISSQIALFDFIKSLGVGALSVFHDLNMAALYCDRLFVIQDGEITLEGAPEDVLTAENIFGVYGARSVIKTNPLTGRPAIAFLPSSAGAQGEHSLAAAGASRL